MATSPNHVGHILLPEHYFFRLFNKNVKYGKNKQYFTCLLNAWMGYSTRRQYHASNSGVIKTTE